MHVCNVEVYMFLKHVCVKAQWRYTGVSCLKCRCVWMHLRIMLCILYVHRGRNGVVTAAMSCRAAVVACFVRVSCRCFAWNWVWLVSQRICRLEDRIFAYLITIARKHRRAALYYQYLLVFALSVASRQSVNVDPAGVHHTSHLTQLQHKVADRFTHIHMQKAIQALYVHTVAIANLAPLSIGEITSISFNDFTRYVVITVIPLRASHTTKSWHTRDIMCGIWWRHQFNNILFFDRYFLSI